MIDWLSPVIIFPEEHAAIGALAVAAAYSLAPGRLGDPLRSHPKVPSLAVAAFSVIVLPKELLWDPGYEVGQSFLWAGATDLLWYSVGIGAMFAALWLRFRLL